MKQQKKQQRRQKGTPFLALRIVLSVIILGYTLLGLAALIGGETALNASSAFYGASLTLDPQASHIIRILGAYMLGIALLALFAWNNPVKNRAIINCIIILLLIRVVEKLVFFKEVGQAFSISAVQLVSGAVLLLVLAALLFFLRPKE
ncbi:hypothetical protein HYZ97_04485 [Candidatus Pacearchaeota archaeon]|nr:hypothetical protein [Candidatus Pacearchaeota archaeon]